MENINPITLTIKPEMTEGQILAEIIARSGRTNKELAPLLDVAEQNLTYNRLKATKTLGRRLATNATIVFGLPPHTFRRAAVEGIPRLPSEELKRVDPFASVHEKLDQIIREVEIIKEYIRQ